MLSRGTKLLGSRLDPDRTLDVELSLISATDGEDLGVRSGAIVVHGDALVNAGWLLVNDAARRVAACDHRRGSAGTYAKLNVLHLFLPRRNRSRLPSPGGVVIGADVPPVHERRSAGSGSR